MKNILVATTTSVNKRKFIVEYIQKYFDQAGMSVMVNGLSIYDLKDGEGIDVLVRIGNLSFEPDIPIVDGTPFITQMGMEDCCAKIKDFL